MDFSEESLRKDSDHEDGKLYEHEYELERKTYEASPYDGFLVPFIEINSLRSYPVVGAFHIFDISVLLESLLNVLVGYKSQGTP